MIYLDHAAATPVAKKVFEAMRPYFSEQFFNPSAAYLPAREVAEKYAVAKNEIAHAVGAKGNDIVITGGATEANNLAFSAVLATAGSDSGSAGQASERVRTDFANEAGASEITAGAGKVLYLATEHDSVRAPAKKYPHGEIRVRRDGRIDLDDLRAKIDDETTLISVALVNNELGNIQPLSEVAEIVRKVRTERLARGNSRPLYLHSDASQALNLLEVNVARLGVDLLTMNAAKIYGPKGVGALYVSHAVKLSPATVGGGQERGLRAGTENVAGAVGFAEALKETREHLNGNRKKYARMKKLFLENLEDFQLINTGKTLDNFIVLCFNGLDAERLVFLLEEKGVLVATGAACAASKGEKSHVLAAIGLSDAEIAGSLRISFGETNDETQILEAARIINAAVKGERVRVNGR